MSKKLLKYAAIVALVGSVMLFTFAKRNDFGLGRNMEIAVNMMRELSLYFVDEVDPDKMMEGIAQGMVRNLDPYTEYMSEAEMGDFDLMTTGKYGGVGSLIRKRGEHIAFAQPYKGSPADKAGIRIGDKIIAINSEDAKGFSVEQVSKRMKGDPGTTLTLTIERLIGGKQETITLTRERIAIPGIPYAGYVADGIGYIQHSDFTEGCYDDMRAAIERLRTQGELRGLILDYRNNGGGILQEAVKILSMFVPKGTAVVTTKGRTENKSFRTTTDPTLPNLPLAVLINGNSASAAEIVAGALQDLDRAVVVGQKSFGKGLVQSTRPLGYNAFLKLTTAKYYIPSGRCIQAVDYSHSQEGEVKVVPDSLIREFTTLNGRKVYDGGGVMPDLKSTPEYSSRFAMTLYLMGFIDDFGDRYMQKNPSQKVDSRTFAITKGDYADFMTFMKEKVVPYESGTRRALKSLAKAAEEDRYSDITEAVKRVQDSLKDDTATNLENYKNEITELIESDIIMRHNYVTGVIERNVTDGKDPDVKLAFDVLSNAAEYKRIVEQQDTQKK